jgi:hypothetical protein
MALEIKVLIRERPNNVEGIQLVNWPPDNWFSNLNTDPLKKTCHRFDSFPKKTKNIHTFKNV